MDFEKFRKSILPFKDVFTAMYGNWNPVDEEMEFLKNELSKKYPEKWGDMFQLICSDAYKQIRFSNSEYIKREVRALLNDEPTISNHQEGQPV